MKFDTIRLQRDIADLSIKVNNQETATILDELAGKDMSWESYDKIVDNLLILDEKIQRTEYPVNHG